MSGNTVAAKFVGGSGVNTLTLSDASLLAPGSSLNGGTGTLNTLQVAGLTGSAAEYTAINAATGFSTLGLIDSAGIFGDRIDASQLASIKNFIIEPSNADDVITNIASGSTVTVLHSIAAGNGLDTLSSAVAPGSSLTLNLGTAASSGITEYAIVTGFPVVNLTSNGTAANTLHLIQADNISFNLTGSDALTVSTADVQTGNTFNASAFTGTLTLNDSGEGDLISTGSGTTTVTETGPGFDTLTFLAGHTKADTFVSSATGSTTASSIDKVTNFTFSLDVLKNAGDGALKAGTELNATAGSGIVTTGNGGFANAAAFITAAEATAGTKGDAIAYTDGTNTYVAEFGGGNGTTHIVELIGVTATAIGGTGAGHILIG